MTFYSTYNVVPDQSHIKFNFSFYNFNLIYTYREKTIQSDTKWCDKEREKIN